MSVVPKTLSGFHVSMSSFNTNEDDDNEMSYYDTEKNWKSCVFLQFKPIWRFIVSLGILVNIVLVLYYLMFSQDHDALTFTMVYYAFEFSYFFDVCLAIMYRCMDVHRFTVLGSPRHPIRLLVDVLSVLPYYELYCVSLRTSVGPNYEPITDYMKFKVMLRLQYIFFLYLKIRSQPSSNQVLAVIAGQLYFFILYVMTACSIWYFIRDITEYTWVINLVYFKFDESRPLDWLVVCLSTVGNCFMNNWSGNTGSENVGEYSMLMITIIMGYLLRVMIFFGDLTAQYIQIFKQQIGFSSRLNVIVDVLKDWHTSETVIKKTIEHYNKFWEVRKAMITIPRMVKELPLSMQKEIALDIFWECLQHTHFFKDCDISFKRSLALGIQPEIYLPGDILVQKGKMKTKMMYLSSGIVQVLSQNQSSPMLSFSSGTVFGELCTILSVVSHVTIRCASYCEIHTLDIRWLCRVLAQYKDTSSSLQENFQERLESARMMQSPVLLKMKNRQQKSTSIHWLRNQWKYIMVNTRSRRDTDNSIYDQNPCHTSEFLDLYVLSDDVELKLDVICLKHKCPCIMEPGSSFRKSCGHVVLLAAAVQCLIVPYCVFFLRAFTKSTNGVLYLMDLIYVMGFYMELTTAIRKDQQVITDCKTIVLQKLRRLSTMIDIFSTLPLELFAMAMSAAPALCVQLHLNRILKAHRIFLAVLAAENNLWLNPLRLKLVRYGLIYVYFIYFVSCVMYGLTCPSTCNRYGWLKYIEEVEENQNFTIPEEELPTEFLSSVTFAMSILLSLTDSMYSAYIIKDMIMEFIVAFIGYCMYSFAFSELAGSAVLQMKPFVDYLEYLNRVRYFFSQYDIPSDVKKLVYKVTQCHWDYCKRYPLTGEGNILSDAPDNIKNSVLYGRIVQSLRTVILLSNMGDNILWNVAPLTRLHVIPPGTVMCREHTFASDIHIVLRGYCTVESNIPTDKYHGATGVYQPGDGFPMLGLLFNIKTFVKITSITFVELAVLPFDKIMIHLRNNNMPLYNDMMMTIEAHRRANYIILMRRKGRLPEMVSQQKSQGRGEYFAYDTNENFDDSPIDKNMMGPYVKLGKWKCIRYFFLRKTISPTKRCYIVWESIRCFTIFVNLVYTWVFYKYCVVYKIDDYCEIVFLVIFVIDAYIRMHCQYYDTNGILIVHPLRTSKYYLCGAFILDLYINLPFTLLRLQKMTHGVTRGYISYMFMLLTRPLNYYRIYGALQYIEKSARQDKFILYYRIKDILLVTVIFLVLASALEHLTCDFVDIDDYVCSNSTWVGISTFGPTITYLRMSVICYYQIVIIYAAASSGTFLLRSYSELIIYIGMVFILMVCKWFILARVISSLIRGNVKLVEYQHNVKVMIKFMHDKLISDSMSKEITDHYENLYTKTQGCDANVMLSSFLPMIARDVSDYMYGNTLQNAELFLGCIPADIWYFSRFFKEIHLKKDADIIRCNQVQDAVFVVYKGKVKISIADTKLTTLLPGGMFGCFHAARTRQTITATALVHVELLTIRSVKLNGILERYPSLRSKLKRMQLMNVEYMDSTLKTSEVGEHAIIEVSETIVKKNLWQRMLINSNNGLHEWYEYFIKMHVSPIGSILTISYIIDHSMPYQFIYFLYFIDLLFVTKIIIAFNLTYVDHETGLLMNSFKKIMKKYFTKLDGFVIDIVTCFPCEMFASIYFDITEEEYRYCIANRALRFLHMINYYNNWRNKLTVSKALKWTFLMYILALLVQFMSCFWFLISCPNHRCHIMTAGEEEGQVIEISDDESLNFRLVYEYVISLFTSTGIRDQMPSSVKELVATIIMIYIFQALMIALTSGFASLLSVGKYVMNKYGEEMEKLRIYMQSTHVSISIIDRVEVYLSSLWLHYSGHSVPQLIMDAPTYLKQDILFALYGHHLLNHTLFAKTHIDFIKQLVLHMRSEVYLPGQYIIQKGDVDGRIYFLHDGEARVLDKLGNNEIEQYCIFSGGSFGEYQGLKILEHVRSVRASMMSIVICLETSEWEYLLTHFPASKEMLFDTLRHYSPI